MRAFSLVVIVLTMASSSCRKCADCTYYEEDSSGDVYFEEDLGEACGDEIRALEKKEYFVEDGKGYAKCVDK